MEIFPTLRLIGQPGTDRALETLAPADAHELLILYHGEIARRAFLNRILAAAGYDAPGEQLHLLEWPQGEALDLAAVIRATGVKRVILFGYDLPNLGLHFTVANYFPVAVAGVLYLVADSLEFIEDAKEKGDNRPAGALWKAVSTGFKRP